MRVPHANPPKRPAATPSGRFYAHCLHDTPASCEIALLGLPDDLGVRLNNGRPGAAQGPTAFRAALASYGVAQPAGFSWPRVFDAGDIDPAPGSDASALAETHRRITEAAATLHEAGLFPIAVGGGHDLTFPFVRAAVAHHAPHDPSSFAVAYIDPHLDVRDTPGSGMPFRRLVEECLVGRLLIAGHSPLVNAREHTAWFHAHGGTIADDDWADRLEEDADDAGTPELLAPLDGSAHLAVSFDLDAIDAAFAPGVSARNPAGLDPRRASKAIFRLASDPRTRCLDIMELSPPHDDPPDGGRTARLAAHLFLHALMGWRWGRVLRGEA